MNTVVITSTTGVAGARVRVDGCPRCKRTLTLDHAGVTENGENYVDLGAVMFAQQLHLANCTG